MNYEIDAAHNSAIYLFDEEKREKKITVNFMLDFWITFFHVHIETHTIEDANKNRIYGFACKFWHELCLSKVVLPMYEQ